VGIAKHILVIFLICTSLASAEGWQFDFILENDAIFIESINHDRYYTNGVQMKLKSPELYEFTLGQLFFTPDNQKTTLLQAQDRPYAGWLFVSAAKNTLHDSFMRHMQLTVGVIGESALGEQMQNGYHSISGNNRSNGWDNQLPNEPAVMLSASQVWALNQDASSNNFSWNLLPYAGAHLGSPYTAAEIGAELRLGYRMPKDYTISGISFISGVTAATNTNHEHFYGYLFAGVDSSAMLWNTFLDGSVFRDSHSIDNKPVVTKLTAGFVFNIRRAKITYTQVYQTKEFYGQLKNHIYGSVQIGYLF
jgi:hypothetical protein